jgi:predicted small lipoprotein YifL
MSTPTRTALHALAVLALVVSVAACGQKGALYLPEKPQPVEPQDGSAVPPAPDDTQ